MRGYEIAPGIDGFRAAQNDYLIRQQAGLSQVSGLLGLQNSLLQMQQSQELAPLQRRLLEAQVEKNLRPASPFGKIDPKDYTAESLTKFANSGNYSDLVPVRKNEVVNLGGKSVVIDPYAIAPNTDLAHTATPHQTWQQTVQFPWTQQVDRANVANSAANVGIAGANLFYNTGMSPMGGGATLPRPMGTVPAPLPPSPLAPAGVPAPSAAPRPAPLGVVPPRSNTPAAPQAIVPTGATMPTVPGGVQLPPRLLAEAEADRLKNEPKEQERKRQNLEKIDNVMGTVDRALSQSGFTTTGLTGAVLSNVPGSRAYDLKETIKTIKANIGFNTLQQMREASPTGGALGQVAVQELDALQAAIASLDQAQSEPQLRSNLENVNKHYANWKKTLTGQPVTAAPTQNPQRRSGDILNAADAILGIR